MIKQSYLRISLAYSLLLPVVAVLILVLAMVPLFVSNGIMLENNPFLESMKAQVAPERIEQVRYILAIASVPIVFTLLMLFFRQKVEFLTTNFSRSITFYGALLIQLSLLIFCIYNGNIGNPVGSLALTPYQPSFFIAGIAIVILFTFIFLAYAEIRNSSINESLKWIANLVVIAYVLVRLLPSIGFSGNFSHSGSVEHQLVYMGEFSPILYGHTMLVDFFPQYQTLQAYLCLPIFYIFGFSYATFSLTMASFIFIGTTLMYQVFKAVTRSTWIALLLFIPFVSVMFFPIDDQGGGKLYGTYTLASIGAVRYFGWMLVTYLLCKTLQRNYSYKMMAVLFVLGGLVAINNADFGIPSLVGSLAAILLIAEQSLLPSLRTSLKIGITFFASVLMAIGLFIGFTYIRSGQLPDMLSVLAYQRIFAYYGFGMFPMPNWGLQWLIYTTFMATILVAVYKKLNHGESPLNSQEKLRIGLLIFSGISGCGLAMYYVGRSHQHVMTAIFTTWSFSLLLLIWEQFSDWRNNWRHFSRRDHLIRYIPSVVLLFAYFSFLGNVLTTPSPFVQINRIMSSNDGSYQQMVDNFAGFIKSNTRYGEKVSVISNLGHEIANAAQVFNVFPYARPAASLILKEQVNKVMLQIKNEDVKKIFVFVNGGVPPELTEQISSTYTLSDLSNAVWQYFVRKEATPNKVAPFPSPFQSVPIVQEESVHPQAAETDSAYPMFHTIPDQVTAKETVTNAEEGGLAVLLVPAPGEMRFSVKPGNHQLNCEFGLLVSTYIFTNTPTDGVEFSASLLESGQETVLFKRFLQPVQESNDRGIQSCGNLAFAVKTRGDLVLRTHPGPANNADYDWSFWRAVKID